MINLSKLFKTDPKVPTVAAVIVNKAADLEVAKARLTKANFQIEKFDDTQDGVIIFPQSDNIEDITPGKDGTYIIKMDEMLSCLITNVAKAFEPINFDSASFDEVLAQEGMRPGIHLSMDVLGATVSNILAKSENRDEMVTDLSKALDEFKTHIVSMASAVPENAFSVDFFKAENFVVAKADDGTDGAKSGEGDVAPVVPVSDPPADDEAAKAIEAAKLAEAGKPAAGDNPEGDKPPVAAAPEMGEVLKQLAALAKGINTVGSMLKATDEKLDEQGKRIDNAAALAKSAKDAISGVVMGGAHADPDAAPITPKNEGNGADIPLIDTAYHKLN